MECLACENDEVEINWKHDKSSNCPKILSLNHGSKYLGGYCFISISDFVEFKFDLKFDHDSSTLSSNHILFEIEFV